MAQAKKRAAKPRAGFFTKLLILLLLAAFGAQLYALRGQVEEAEAQKALLAAQVAQRQQENAELQEGIENGGSEDEMRKIARRDLGMVDPNDKVFYATSS